MPIPKLLLAMAVPMMASMLVQALYNIVDSMFVARVPSSDQALAALSLAFPIQMLVISFASGTGVGVNSLLARKLGEKKPDEATAVAQNGLAVSAFCGIFFALFGLIGVPIYFKLFTADATLLSMGISYTSICCFFSAASIIAIVSERVMQATGRVVYSMISQMTGAITNIILDPILIFGFFGFPAMGVTGAAIATGIGQLVSMLVILYFNLTKNHDVSFDFRRFKLHGATVFEIYRVGLPSILMQSIGSVMTVGMNKILISFSAVAVSVFGIYFKLQSFIFMPVFGLTSSMIPIISFNYGARSKARIVETLKISIIMAVSIMAVGTVLFQVFPGWMLSVLFQAHDEMLLVGVPALQTISLCFIPAAMAIVFSSAFQALGNGLYSLIMAIVRQLVMLLPAAWLIGRLTNELSLVWLAFPFAEAFSFLLALFLFKRLYDQRVRYLI